MKAIIIGNGSSRNPVIVLSRAIIVAGFLFCAANGRAQLPPGGKTNSYQSYTPLDSWSFYDHANWTSDAGHAPVSFTNLGFSYLGDGASMVLDSTNPAWLQYNVIETNGATNLTVDVGSVTFWFAPNWSSTNADGNGPGESGRLLEVGGYTPDSSLGWWSIYVDDGGNNIYFSTQTNDLSSNVTTYVSAPISWTTNYFHYVALTYCATNTALYLDGGLAATGPPLTVYPGPDVLANGFFIGSDSNGIWQAHGLFNNVYAYNVPLDAGTIQDAYNWGIVYYRMNPNNIRYMAAFNSSTNSAPSYTPTYDAITGQGNLQFVGQASSCVTSSNVWITNVVVTAAANGRMSITFTIEGGSNGVPYDVFANSLLDFSSNSSVAWGWMGQGYQCNTYTLPGLPSGTVFLILGTPKDSDGDGLTDAYELLVSKTNPNNPDTDGDGISDSDEVLNQTNPLTPNGVFPATLNIQTCPQ